MRGCLGHWAKYSPGVCEWWVTIHGAQIGFSLSESASPQTMHFSHFQPNWSCDWILLVLVLVLVFFDKWGRTRFQLMVPFLRELSLRNSSHASGFHWTTFLSPSGDLGISLVWHNLSGPPRSFLVRLLKSSSNWTKLSMRGPQLFSGWYQMIFRLGSDWVQFRFRLGSDYVQTRFSVGTE